MSVQAFLKYRRDTSFFSSQEMTAYKKKIQNDGAPMVGAAQANQTVIKSDSEEEAWKDDDE